MKARHISANIINPWEIINHFGNALLIQRADGKHEPVGGSDGDYTAAKERVSLFAHEIVFTQSVKRRQRRGFSLSPDSVK
jgi:hypothetical protein